MFWPPPAEAATKTCCGVWTEALQNQMDKGDDKKKELRTVIMADGKERKEYTAREKKIYSKFLSQGEKKNLMIRVLFWYDIVHFGSRIHTVLFLGLL